MFSNCFQYKAFAIAVASFIGSSHRSWLLVASADFAELPSGSEILKPKSSEDGKLKQCPSVLAVPTFSTELSQKKKNIIVSISSWPLAQVCQDNHTCSWPLLGSLPRNVLLALFWNVVGGDVAGCVRINP